ncbi:MAG: hypothetical protein M1339_06335 [Bacteroidetes bacterium]|nr:hypothetical protein [Bacteroidota bacterium]
MAAVVRPVYPDPKKDDAKEKWNWAIESTFRSKVRLLT